MAAFPATIVGGPIQGQLPGRSTNLDGYGPPASAGAAGLSTLVGSMASPGMSPEVRLSFDGAEASATHLWDRMILAPKTKSLGLIASQQTFSVEVWSTFRRTQFQISSALVSGQGGLQLSGVALPSTLGPMASRIFTATVPENGTATIANVATFSVAEDKSGGLVLFTPVLTVDGLRIAAFPFEPNWERGVKESVEYMTQILTARTGMEQRYKLRHIPRRKLSFDVLPTDGEVQTLDSLLWARQGQIFGVPWWPDGVRLSGALVAGASTITLDTTNRLFALAKLVMVWQSPSLCEVQTVTAVTPTQVSCTPLSNSYTNPIVLPVFQGRIDSTQEVSRLVRAASQASVKFACEVALGDPRPSPAAAPVTVYGFEVLTVDPNWDGPTQTVRRILERTDNGYGPVLVEDRGGVSFQGQAFRWMLSNRVEAQAFRDFFDRRMGRAVPFWVPTWREDLTLVQEAPSNTTGIVVRDCGYTNRMFPDTARRYLAIRTPAGGWIYRKVLSASVAGGQETLGLDAQHGVTLPAGTVVSFLVLCRMEEDGAEITWETTTVGQATTRGTELPKEVV